MTKRDLIEVVPESSSSTEQKHWKSLNQLSFGSEYQDSAHREFLSELDESTGVKRRDMLKLMGASFALAGVSTACVRRPEEHILPYSKQPELVPGVADYYATAIPGPMGAEGLLVESHEGRPTKIEGNPSHYDSGGATSTHGQASVLELYDPNRSTLPYNGKKPSTWSDFDQAVNGLIAEAKKTQGQGLAVLVDGSEQPTRERVLGDLSRSLPKAQIYRWDPLALNNTQIGVETVFGGGARLHLKLENAKAILALDSDFLSMAPEHISNARGFGAGRALKSAKDASKMNRLYAVEGNYSLTGTNADERLRISSSEAGGFLQALASNLFINQNVAWPAALGDDAVKTAFLATLKPSKLDGKAEKFLKALSKDLAAHKGASFVSVGEHQAPAVHALAAVVNIALGGFGKTFKVSVPQKPAPVLQEGADGEVNEETAPVMAPLSVTSTQQFAALEAALSKGSVKTLIVMGGNPAITAASSFNASMAKASTVVHYGLYRDETAINAAWHAPMAHFLESWGDVRSYNGQASVIQPLIAPLHGARSEIEHLNQWNSGKVTKGHDLVKKTWSSLSINAWRKALHEGILTSSNRNVMSAVEASVSGAQKALAAHKTAEVSDSAVEVVVTPDLKLLDGRYSNLGWLQELPDPITKLTWDNAVLVSPALARRMKLSNKVEKNAYNAEVLAINANGASVEIPSFVLPGLAENTVVVHTGHGRQSAGDVGNGVGVSVQALQSGGAYEILNGAQLTKTGRKVILASTQDHFSMDNNPYQEIERFNESNAINPGEDRNQLRNQTSADYAKNPTKSAKHDLGTSLLQVIDNKLSEKPIQMIDDPFDYSKGQQWGMVVDLNTCLGCGACVVACQAENNIPVVGREQVLMGRELHWNRTDRYFTGEVDDPTTGTMPITCLHCENAPCEPVCPVAATVHGTEGLNSMVYNRCIGTRYCANNCPVKVRRFNYFDYSDSGNVYVPEDKLERRKILSMQKNPDVTVRYRGVMEKCTYCTQRIQEAKMVAKRKGEDPRALPDGAITPACAQTCATGAVSFGNINDPKSKVAQMKSVDRNYELLKELNIRPRTSYLAKVRNRNPELAS